MDSNKSDNGRRRLINILVFILDDVLYHMYRKRKW